eukprot:TRINITY_DN19351_c0_g1_i1.p1 TRINITY_DN19351_c0_g1~~TRINITY_DN19351_c0_g1_i1.p1  ORF type:complete len:226 (-),score=25.84 TRINITY_DN19351_c0_g1_i1:218-895(-)
MEPPCACKEAKPYVIGISGATRSGKGSLAKRITEKLHNSGNVARFCQDAYFNTGRIYGQLGGNWDQPEAIDHERLLADLRRVIADSKTRFVVLEGFMLFHDTALFELLDARLWLDVSHDCCYERRMRTKPLPHMHFVNWVWPNYLTYSARVRADASVERISGELPEDDVFQLAWRHLSARIPAHYLTTSDSGTPRDPLPHDGPTDAELSKAWLQGWKDSKPRCAT